MQGVRVSAVGYEGDGSVLALSASINVYNVMQQLQEAGGGA